MRPMVEVPPREERTIAPDLTWAGRRDRVVVVIGYVALAALGLWLAGLFARALLLLAIAALLAYALFPLVRRLEQHMPRRVALLLVYLVLIGSLGTLAYFVVSTAINQVSPLITQLSDLLTPGPNGAPSALIKALERLGLSSDQIAALKNQLIGQLEGFAQQAVPFIAGVVNSILDVLLVVVLSIYLLIDGGRLLHWLSLNSPLPVRPRLVSFIGILERVVGGYIRSQLIMSSLIGVLVGAGMFLFHVPDAILLGVLAFILEFIPTFGTLLSGVICVLIALTQGWLIALFVLIYFVVVHVIEGDVVGPRVLGKAVGLHPAISLIALIAGGELFGIIGALFASLVAGLLQAILLDVFLVWRQGHPQHFPAELDPEGPATLPATVRRNGV